MCLANSICVSVNFCTYTCNITFVQVVDKGNLVDKGSSHVMYSGVSCLLSFKTHLPVACIALQYSHYKLYFSQSWVRLFVRLARDNIGYIDWSPHLEQV